MQRLWPELDFPSESMRKFLCAPLAYPVWLPRPMSWDAEHVSRITNMRIPKTSEQGGRRGDPDLNLYRLGQLGDLDPSFERRLEQFTSGNHHTLLVNTSGSGKTRMLMEVLYRHWGFYLGADIDYTSNAYGSGDFPALVRDLPSLLPYHLPLNSRAIMLSNVAESRRIVAARLRRVMLSRLLVLDHFLHLADQCAIDDADARTKWLWLQIRPREMVGTEIFQSISANLLSWSEPALATRWQELLDEHRGRIEYVGLDEAQILVRKCRTVFMSSKHRHHQPLLHALVADLASSFTDSRFIVSGTQIPLPIVADAIELSHHPVKALVPFTAFGDFGHLDRTTQYLRHFFGNDIPDDLCALGHRWLRGRHRMMSVLVDRTLCFGLAKYVAVINSIVFTTTGVERPNAEDKAMVGVNLSVVIEDERLEGNAEVPALLSPALRSAAYIFLTHGAPAVFDRECGNLVGTGLARFGEDMELAYVDEPIMLLNLARWLQNSRRFSAASILRRRSLDSSASVRGLALSEAIAFSFWRAFGASGLRLDQIARFPRDIPFWASRRGTFSTAQSNNGRRSFRKPAASPSPLVRVAHDVDDVLDWFTDATAPFLIPDSEFGAQLLFILDTLPAYCLVAVHLDPFGRDRPRRDKRVVPRPPYSQNRDSRTKFAKAISTLATDLDLPKPKRPSTSRSAESCLNILQIYCFAEIYKPDRLYDPPVATMRIRDLVVQGHIADIAPADMAASFL